MNFFAPVLFTHILYSFVVADSEELYRDKRLYGGPIVDDPSLDAVVKLERKYPEDNQFQFFSNGVVIDLSDESSIPATPLKNSANVPPVDQFSPMVRPSFMRLKTKRRSPDIRKKRVTWNAVLEDIHLIDKYSGQKDFADPELIFVAEGREPDVSFPAIVNVKKNEETFSYAGKQLPSTLARTVDKDDWISYTSKPRQTPRSMLSTPNIGEAHDGIGKEREQLKVPLERKELNEEVHIPHVDESNFKLSDISPSETEQTSAVESEYYRDTFQSQGKNNEFHQPLNINSAESNDALSSQADEAQPKTEITKKSDNELSTSLKEVGEGQTQQIGSSSGNENEIPDNLDQSSCFEKKFSRFSLRRKNPASVKSKLPVNVNSKISEDQRIETRENAKHLPVSKKPSKLPRLQSKLSCISSDATTFKEDTDKNVINEKSSEKETVGQKFKNYFFQKDRSEKANHRYFGSKNKAPVTERVTLTRSRTTIGFETPRSIEDNEKNELVRGVETRKPVTRSMSLPANVQRGCSYVRVNCEDDIGASEMRAKIVKTVKINGKTCYLALKKECVIPEDIFENKSLSKFASPDSVHKNVHQSNEVDLQGEKHEDYLGKYSEEGLKEKEEIVEKISMASKETFGKEFHQEESIPEQPDKKPEPHEKITGSVIVTSIFGFSEEFLDEVQNDPSNIRVLYEFKSLTGDKMKFYHRVKKVLMISGDGRDENAPNFLVLLLDKDIGIPGIKIHKSSSDADHFSCFIASWASALPNRAMKSIQILRTRVLTNSMCQKELDKYNRFPASTSPYSSIFYTFPDSRICSKNYYPKVLTDYDVGAPLICRTTEGEKRIVGLLDFADSFEFYIYGLFQRISEYSDLIFDQLKTIDF